MSKRLLAFAAALGFTGAAYLPAQQAGLEYRYFDSSGVRLAYLEKGRGEPVILLHGGMADSEFNWIQFGILDALAQNHWTIALDLRGHGRSGKPHEASAYGRRMASDVIALMDHLQIEKAHVLGYSMGSVIGLTLVADHPMRILSAAFGGPGWVRPDTDLTVYRKTAESLEAGKGLGPLLEGYQSGEGKPLSEKELAQLNAFFAARNDLLAIAASLRGYADLAVTEDRLKAAHVSCLFLIGTKDDMRKDIPLLRAAMGDYASFADIPDASHGDAIARPEFRDAVLKFFTPRAVPVK